MSSEYTDVASIAKHLNVSERTVRRMLKRGLRHTKLDDAQQGRVLIRWSDLDAWLEARTVEHQPGCPLRPAPEPERAATGTPCNCSFPQCRST